MSNLFLANFQLSHPQRAALRAWVKKWGIFLITTALIVILWVSFQRPAPEDGLAFDATQKASFGLMRLVLTVVGWFIGVFMGYLVFQVIEGTTAGSHTTLIDPVTDSEPVKSAKTLNRGILLTILCAVGGLVVALALAGK